MTPMEPAASSPLDAVRRTRGAEACRQYFRALQNSRKPYALLQINDPHLTFGTFFLLLPGIRAGGDEAALSERNRTAARLCRVILGGKKANGTAGRTSLTGPVLGTLLWMFRTGAADDGLSDDFDQILDVSASILLKKYRRSELIPTVAQLIFRRNRKGAYLHDLVWALFQSRDPRALRSVADYLRSPHQEDVRLARVLLHLPAENSPNGRRQYAFYLNWLDENRSSLYFTGENFNETSRPGVCSVNIAAKYLCRRVRPDSNSPLTPLTEAERGCLPDFKKAGEKEQALLSSFSQKVRKKNPLYWNRWIRYPIRRQIAVAKNGGEGSV